MFRVKLILFAQSVVIDKRTNLVTLCNVTEEFHAKEVPINIPPTNLLIYFQRDDIDPNSKFPIKVVISLNDKILGENNTSIDFQNRKKHRLVVGYSTILINEFGILKFEIFNEDKSLSVFECPIIHDPTLKQEIPSS